MGLRPLTKEAGGYSSGQVFHIPNLDWRRRQEVVNGDSHSPRNSINDCEANVFSY